MLVTIPVILRRNEDDSNDEGEEDDETENVEEEEEEDGPEIEMQWNLASYLPEAGACQKNFSTVVAGYITANYQFLQEEMERVVPGMTPVRRRRNISQVQPLTRFSSVSTFSPKITVFNFPKPEN